MDWKKKLDDEFPVRDSRTEDFIRTEIIKKLIADMTSTYIGGKTSQERVKQQLRDKWL